MLSIRARQASAIATTIATKAAMSTISVAIAM
jgi:hypothetical protein